MNIAYDYGNNSLYLNITNQCCCNCSFCVRNDADGVHGHKLWLDHEPSVDEIKEAIIDAGLETYEEVVFCGYGEPCCRLDALLETGEFLKELMAKSGKIGKKPIRLNTSGLSDLINGKRTAHLLAQCIDHVSISLNAPDADIYYELCNPKYGRGSFDAMIDFAKDCKACIKDVTLSVVKSALDAEALERCHDLCARLELPLRVRTHA